MTAIMHIKACLAGTGLKDLDFLAAADEAHKATCNCRGITIWRLRQSSQQWFGGYTPDGMGKLAVQMKAL